MVAISTKKKINDVKLSSKKKMVSVGSKVKTNTKIKRKLQDVNLNKIKKVLVPKSAQKILSPAKKILRVLSKKKTKPNKKVIKKKILIEKPRHAKLKKVKHNPILSPSHYRWESKATFNPAVFTYDDDVHIIYRAIGEDDSSVLGYARSIDGVNIVERPPYFIFRRPATVKIGQKMNYSSGGNSCGGCEDPRIVLIEGVLYLTYTAFDGWNSVRMALTSISLPDFKNKKWNWRKPVFISPSGEVHKNWVIFPEKINGKYAIMHSLSPEILIDYIDDLREFNGQKFIYSIHDKHPKWKEREKGIRGVGPIPIKTKDGWLVLYHKTEAHEPNKYKIFAMMLDAKNPTKILYKTEKPILEPEEEFEMEGYRGIVYCCGAVIKNDNLFVYYGGGDRYVCVAEMKLEELLEKMKEDKIIKLKNIKEISSK